MLKHKVIHFGPFAAHLDSGELRREGHKIRLQAQPFDLLMMLLERPGEVLSRDEIRDKLWPADTFVDFDHSLGTAINKVRAALNDSAESPRFVETLPKRGYRFIGAISPSPLPAVSVKPHRGTNPHSSWRITAGILAVLICAWAVAFAYRWYPPRTHAGLGVHTAAPFTSLPGVETSPTFSPDGSRIAFAWDGGSTSVAKGFDLYVKAIGSETLLRLTHHPSEWISSAWSPDGTQIAFHRMSGPDTGVYVVPALGGSERKLRSTRVPYAVAAPISWSSDGKWIAFGDPLPEAPIDRILLLSVDTLETRRIPHNPKCLHEGSPIFSHSGPELAYVCVHSTNEFELYSVAPLGGTPRLITAFSNFPVGFTWSADDRKLVLSLAADAGLELEEVTLADGSIRHLDFALDASWPAVASKGDKLAYSASSGQTNIWRKDLLHPESPAVELITSSRAQDDAQYSPDGKHIAFESTRAGSQDIWMSDADGSNLVQVSKLIRNAGIPRWSPDGKKIAFDSRRLEIYVTDMSEQLPRKLVTNVSKMTAPNWSRDGKWIYFRSYEVIGQKIYRCPATGGEAIALGAQPDGTFPQESFDGSVLYFARRNVNTGVGMLSPHGTFLESSVEGLPAIVHENLWTVRREGIYFVPADSPRSLHYFDFATKKVREIFKINRDFGDGLSVSPDGHWLLYTQVDEENSDIMLVDRFS